MGNRFVAGQDGFVQLQTEYTDQRTINDLSLLDNKVRIKKSNAQIFKYINGDFTKYFVSPPAQELLGGEYDLATTKMSDIYAGYDAIMNNHASRVERKLL